MPETLTISWGTGKATILLEAFFPCPATQFRDLLKVIRQDWNHCDELRETLRQYFTSQIEAKEAEYKARAKDYWDYRQKMADYHEILINRKYPNGLPLPRNEVKDYQKYVANYKASRDKAKRAALKAKKDKEWFEKYASLRY